MCLAMELILQPILLCGEQGPTNRENPPTKRCRRAGVACSRKAQERGEPAERTAEIRAHGRGWDSRVHPGAAGLACGGLLVWKRVLAAVRAVEAPTGNLADRSLGRGNEGLPVTIVLI